MTKEEVQLTAFQIISIAGDAMDDFYQGMNAYLEGINLAAADHLANAISWSRMCQLLIDQMEREEVESYE